VPGSLALLLNPVSVVLFPIITVLTMVLVLPNTLAYVILPHLGFAVRTVRFLFEVLLSLKLTGWMCPVCGRVQTDYSSRVCYLPVGILHPSSHQCIQRGWWQLLARTLACSPYRSVVPRRRASRTLPHRSATSQPRIDGLAPLQC
jgi:hypothetical protein